LTRAWSGRATGWWAAVGALTAALTIVRAVFIVFVPLVVVAALLRTAPARWRIVAATVAGLCAIALLAPWTAWTASVSGKPALANWGEGYNLLLAAAGEGYDRPAEEIDASSAVQSRLERVHRLLPTTGQLRRDPASHARYLADADSELQDEALEVYGERLQDEPARVGAELVYRIWFLWTAHKDWFQPGGAARITLRALDWLALLAASAGAALAFARGGAGRGAVILLAAYSIVLATHHVEARFAMPLRGVYLAFIALALAAVAARLRRNDPE
jgi:hypothetical protein